MELSEYITKTVEEMNGKTSKLSQLIGITDIVEMLQYQNLSKGKKLRAVLCVMVNDALGGNHSTAIDYAMAVEMTHQASIVHDDVVDGDTFRRKQLSLHERFSIGKAILIGDTLISFAVGSIKDMSPVDFAKGARVLADAWQTLAYGAYMEHTMSKNPTEEAYIAMIQSKTGVLFEASAKLGALASNESEAHIKSLAMYGMHIGAAFQIADDLVDIMKSIGTKKFVGDMSDRKITLPLIYLTKMYSTSGQRANVYQRYISGETLTETEVSDILNDINTSGVIKTTQQYVDTLINSSRSLIAWVKDSDYKTMLMELPVYAIQTLMSEVHQ